MQLASDDFTPRWDKILYATSNKYPIIISGNGFISTCPASLGRNASCAINPPHFFINSTTIVFGDSHYSTFDSSQSASPNNTPLIQPQDAIYPPLYNLVQTLLAALRIDLGNASPNNFFLNQSALHTTLYDTFPANKSLNLDALPSLLYDANVNPQQYGLHDLYPLTMEGPASIQVLYLCQLQQLKAPGALVISVLVATLSMSMSGWALFIFIASKMAERHNKRIEGARITIQAPRIDWLRKHSIPEFFATFARV